MSAYSARSKNQTRHASVLTHDDFRIEFEGDVLPPPVSRLGSEGTAEAEETFEERLQRTQEELLHLRQQAMLAEKREEDLKELARKEREYTKGRAEVHEKLAKALVTLERAGLEAQRTLETLLQARDDLARHHRALTSLQVDDWSAPDIGEQADHALAVIHDARLDYERIMNRVADLLPNVSGTGRPAALAGAMTSKQDFQCWLLRGFAFTLPLLLLGLVALILSLTL